MAKEVILETIDDVNYVFGHLTPTKAIKLLSRLSSLLGASLGATTKKDIDGEIDLEAVLGALASRMNEDLVLALIKDSLEQVHAGKDGRNLNCSKNFDDVFDSGLMHLFKVLKKAWEVNFADFFGDQGVIGSIMTKFRGLTQKP